MNSTTKRHDEESVFVSPEWLTDVPTGAELTSKQQGLPVPIIRLQSITSPRTLGADVYQTLLTPSQLTDCGLKVFPHESRNWLVGADTDVLSRPQSSSAWSTESADRIAELRAISNDEALPFNENSARQALKFAAEIDATIRPSAFLLGSGNIRFLWDKPSGEQIGLQFLGNSLIQYVLFHGKPERPERAFGESREQVVLRQISATGLRHLLRF